MRAIQKWSYISNLLRFDGDMTKNIFGRDDKFLKTRVIDLIMTSGLNLIMTSNLNLIITSGLNLIITSGLNLIITSILT